MIPFLDRQEGAPARQINCPVTSTPSTLRLDSSVLSLDTVTWLCPNTTCSGWRFAPPLMLSLAHHAMPAARSAANCVVCTCTDTYSTSGETGSHGPASPTT